MILFVIYIDFIYFCIKIEKIMHLFLNFYKLSEEMFNLFKINIKACKKVSFVEETKIYFLTKYRFKIKVLLIILN